MTFEVGSPRASGLEPLDRTKGKRTPLHINYLVDKINKS